MTNFRDDQGSERRSPTHEEIEKRAYEIYLEHGEEGHALEDWLLAENELRQKYSSRGPIPLKSSSAAAGQRSAVAAGQQRTKAS
jgi:hypothetical protein